MTTPQPVSYEPSCSSLGYGGGDRPGEAGATAEGMAVMLPQAIYDRLLRIAQVRTPASTPDHEAALGLIQHLETWEYFFFGVPRQPAEAIEKETQ